MLKRVEVLGLVLALLIAPCAVSAEQFETIELPGVLDLFGSAVTPDSDTLFVITMTGVIWVYDVETRASTGVINLRDELLRPTAGAVANGKLYVQSFRDIAVIDTLSHDLLAMIPLTPGLGSSYGAVCVSPGEDRVYVLSGSSPDLTVVDPSNDQVTARVNVGLDFTGMGMSPDGRRLYLTSSDENRMLIVDTQTLSIVADVPYFRNHGLSDYKTSVRVNPMNGNVYVAYVDDTVRGRVSLLSPDGTLLDSIGAERFSTGLEITADGRYLVLGCGTILSPSTGESLGTFDTAVYGLTNVRLSPDGSRVFVCNLNDQNVRIVQGFDAALEVSGTPAEGEMLSLSLDLPNEAGQLFQIGAALGVDEGIAIQDGRVVPVDADSLLRFSVKTDNEVFQGFAGRLDGNGRAQALIDLAGSFPGKTIGTEIYLCFVTLDERLARSEVRKISNVAKFTLTD